MTPATPPAADIARALMGRPFGELGAGAQRVARHVAERRHIARDPGQQSAVTPGERAADAVAAFGGSWPFVGLFAVTLVLWIAANSWLPHPQDGAFDPYPYILLNLFLSMLAAIQAPVILMSQNRQARKDRIGAAHDYEVNLKAELEIMMLHDKVDALAARLADREGAR